MIERLRARWRRGGCSANPDGREHVNVTILVSEPHYELYECDDCGYRWNYHQVG